MLKYLSKSSYMAGLECPKRLWQILWDRNTAAPMGGMGELLTKTGTQFGELAHGLFPGATLINVDIFNLDAAVENTRLALDDGVGVILEAAFQHGQCRILADVVERLADGSWHLIEVKSSSSVKDDHINDLAYQKWVMLQAGYPVSRCSVIHVNKEAVWPSALEIFTQVDVSDEVDHQYGQVEISLASMLPLLQLGAESPDSTRLISKKCHSCAFKENVCWQGIEQATIYDVVHASKIPLLESKDILYIEDIPAGFPLNARDRANVDRMVNQEVFIDYNAIENHLATLQYPIYFLDFEFVSPAVPLFDGNHPGERITFQHSLHRLDEDGTLHHWEYLHEENSDPSRPLAQDLVDQIGPDGSIVVYSAGVERGVLKELGVKFPEMSDQLNGMVDRLWDLLPVFRNDYRHWAFGTGWSIKIVTNTLIPEFAYGDLEIREGGSASLAWVEMLEAVDNEVRVQIAEGLRSYCERDTLVMFELIEFLNAQIVN